MPPATVLVRYWAAARAATGVDSESVELDSDLATVRDVVEVVTGRHPGLERVLRVASVLVDARVADRSMVLRDGAVLEVLPPFAGG